MKVCPCCLTERDEKDFYGKEKCYKCIYKDKRSCIKMSGRCKSCGCELPRKRKVYCSKECTQIGRNNYWFKKISTTGGGWKNDSFKLLG